MTELTIAVSDGPNPESKIVVLTGEMDESSVETIKTKLDPLLNDLKIKNFVFDLRQLGFINSKGIGYLVSVHTHLSKNQRELILAEANQAVMDVISLVGLTTIIKYFATMEEALAGL